MGIVPNYILSCQVEETTIRWRWVEGKTEAWLPQTGWHSQSAITLEHKSTIPLVMHNVHRQVLRGYTQATYNTGRKVAD